MSINYVQIKLFIHANFATVVYFLIGLGIFFCRLKEFAEAIITNLAVISGFIFPLFKS